MTNPINRFSSRVDNYIKFRPSYPAEIINLLKADCGLTPESVIADIGSGTGLLSELFLKHGNKVYGIEPNDGMRAAGERLLRDYARFTTVAGTAEKTTLPAREVDFVTAGQAFHWFDAIGSRKEFARILKPGGWVVLIWNERRLDSTPFLRAYEELLLRFGTDYQEVRHENVAQRIKEFFAPAEARFAQFENVQDFDFEGLKGRVLSASYTPEPGHPNFEPMLTSLRNLFDKHAQNGKVAFEYNTTVHYGCLG